LQKDPSLQEYEKSLFGHEEKIVPSIKPSPPLKYIPDECASAGVVGRTLTRSAEWFELYLQNAPKNVCHAINKIGYP
jgi:hypothetical protein